MARPLPRIATLSVLALSLLMPAAARANDGVSYSPSPGFAGSTEQFSACGFQEGETADLVVDNNVVGQATVLAGCANVTFTTPLDMAPNTPHMVSIKGEQSGKEQIGAYLVMPPTVVPVVAVPAGGSGVVTGMYFAPGRTPLLLSGDDHIPTAPGQTDANGNLIAIVSALPDTPAGMYPLVIQDLPWLTIPPPLAVNVVTDSGTNWTLAANSTLTGSGNVSVKASGSDMAQFTVSGGQVKGQGQLNISVDMNARDANCHGESAPVAFNVGGTQDSGGTFHLTFTGVDAAIPITVTCGSGITMPFSLPGGTGSATFDIAAKDGTTADLDGSNPFLMVPANTSGHTHVVLTKSS